MDRIVNNLFVILSFVASTASAQTALPPATSHPTTLTVHTTVVTTDPKTGAIVSKSEEKNPNT